MEEIRSRVTKPLDSPRTIAEMEEIPAYKRREIQLEELNKNRGTDKSKLSINIDENEGPVVERNNSFFHDNVD